MTPAGTEWVALQRWLKQRGERRLVLVEGGRAETLRWLVRCLQALPPESVNGGLWSGPAADLPAEGLTPIEPGKARHWLGRETPLLVIDAWAGQPPDSLAALAGTLQAGGLWFWVAPPLDTWDTFADPDYTRTGLADASGHPFARRLAAVLRHDDSVLRVNPKAGTVTSWPEPWPAGEAPAPGFVVAQTPDQQQAVESIIRTGLGRRRRPLVIRADRGRGKSAALGMAAAQLARQTGDTVLVTAPSKGAVATLFQHARETLGFEAGQDSSESLAVSGGGAIRFLPVDRLLADRPAARVVLVDEAAALPAPLLAAILDGWPRVVYATTVQGYEGSGRGFDVRFRSVLDERTPQWRQIALKRPIRWAETDPVEPLVNRLFLLDAGASSAVPVRGTEPQIVPFSPAHADETQLSTAFGLLVEAHYRTTSGDLRQWLDDPHSRCWLAVDNGTAVAVLWLTFEGGLEAGLADEVASGRRRLRGHLLPQSLASHSGYAAAAQMQYGRVVRIAVAHRWRNRGLGQSLVSAARALCEDEGVEILGTSFGGTAELARFWQKAGLQVSRVGLRREASSGEHALQMLAGLNARGKALVTQVSDRFSHHWYTLLPDTWRNLPPDLVLRIGAGLPDAAMPDADDARELQLFADGHRDFMLSLLPLRRLAAQAVVNARLQGHPEQSLWCRAVLQGWSWEELQRAGEGTGRAEFERRLRALAGELLLPELTTATQPPAI